MAFVWNLAPFKKGKVGVKKNHHSTYIITLGPKHTKLGNWWIE